MKNVYVEKDTLKVIERSIKNNLPLLLVGETGTGKTTLLREFATSKKKNLIRVSLNGSTGTEEILGKYVLNSGETKWQDGILTSALRNGDWVVFDEINSCSPEILFALHSILDDEKSILLTEKDNERVSAHKDFRFFASMNPDDYAGTKAMNQAFLSRFSIVEIDHMNEVDEIAFLSTKTKTAEDKVKQIVSIASELRKLKTNQVIDYFCSTRDLELVCTFANDLSLETAFNVSVFNKMTKLEKDALIQSSMSYAKFINQHKTSLDSKLTQYKEIESRISGFESKLLELQKVEQDIVDKTSSRDVILKEIQDKTREIEEREKNFSIEIDKEVKKRIASLI